MSNSNKMNII